MDEILDIYAPAIIAAISACFIMGLATWFVFGDGIQVGPLSEYIFKILNGWLPGAVTTI